MNSEKNCIEFQIVDSWPKEEIVNLYKSGVRSLSATCNSNSYVLDGDQNLVSIDKTPILLYFVPKKRRGIMALACP